jgi:hypothetical protein
MNDPASEPQIIASLMQTAANTLRSAQELQAIKKMLQEVTFYMKEAESEVSEKMRRFVMYMHDLHDIMFLYESRGLPIPDYVAREIERCDDRYRQLLEEANAEGGVFNKVRRDMAADPNNRWDHTRQLTRKL